MFAIYLLSWWYSRGWVWAISSVFSQLKEINEAFSVPTLLRTWFAPWKQIQTESTFQNLFQAAIDNLISRFVGASVRTALMIGAILVSLIVLVIALLTVVLWPVLPLLLVILPVALIAGGA